MLHKFFTKKKFGFLILLIPLVAITAVIISFVGSRVITNKIDDEVASINTEATLSIGKIKQVSTKDGVKQWSLEADSSQYYQEKSEMVFNMLNVTFFTEDGKEFYLSANHGTLNTDNNNMTVSENVVILDQENRRINADKLHYDKNKHILFSKDPVQLYDRSSVIKADSMEIELNDNKVLFNGNVEGIFSEKNKIF